MTSLRAVEESEKPMSPRVSEIELNLNEILENDISEFKSVCNMGPSIF